jgi:hypothetical protein
VWLSCTFLCVYHYVLLPVVFLCSPKNILGRILLPLCPSVRLAVRPSELISPKLLIRNCIDEWNFFKPASTGTERYGQFRGVAGFVRLPLLRIVWRGPKKSASIQGEPVFWGFLETRTCDPRSLKIILESSRSFRAYKLIDWFSRLLLHTRGCGGPIQTRILTGST